MIYHARGTWLFIFGTRLLIFALLYVHDLVTGLTRMSHNWLWITYY